nr:Toll/interleukin-1 receptor (TIR) domain-containing protein [Tanacetum cinerariifolium]
MTGHTAYPIFYDVERTEIRKQSGVVSEAFAKHENEEASRKWREALKEAADLAGCELKNTNDGHGVEFIEKIVQEISLELRSINSGFDEKDQGMGRSGKTTTARAVFDHLSNAFEAKSFVGNVREVLKASMSGLKNLQEQVLSNVLNEQVNLNSVDDVKGMMKRKMFSKRIIVTTRDEQVLVAHKVRLIRDINLLSYNEAICRYAFGRENPLQGYEELSVKVICYAGGLPLTIKILGSFLFGKDRLEWVDAIDRLKRIPLKQTQEKLELCYRGLEDDYKEIFLDITCILKGKTKEDAIRILRSCGFHARNGLKVLEQRSLITISERRFLGMHDHIEEMGKNIVRRSHPDEPNQHSRLCINEEIKDILANDKGTEATRCLKLTTWRRNSRIVLKGLEKMKKLRYLEYNSHNHRKRQVRIAKGDKAKTTCVTRYGSYEFLVMRFSLTNAPATFCTLMNKLFYLFIDKLMVVYLDGIVVYSHTLEEHVLHLKQVFQVLRDNEIYVKLEKCSFAQDEVEFLGHKIKDGGLMMDGAKIKAIQDWKPPNKVTELRSFLGLVNYYRRFIMGYSAISSSLTDLLKKNKAWIWDEECQATFESLKKAVMKEPVLRLPYVTMPFELHTDASDFAIGGGDLRRAIFKECHDSKWAGHPGITRTLALVEGTYYWPRMGDDVEAFMRTCLICQQYKIDKKKSGGLLEPLPTPKGPWKSVSMNFITCLPKSKGGGSIIVVVDRFSKYGTFIATPPDVTADDTTKHFFKNVVKYWGVSHVIVSDRDPRFIGGFWTELFKIMGTDLNFSTSFHPQMDGANGEGECTIGALSLALSTGKSPFEMVTGRQPLTPNALAASYEGSSPAAYKTIKEWHEQADLARASLDKAAKKMKKWADAKWRHVEFDVSYRVQLPPKLKIHLVFHVSFLKPYHGDEEDPERGVSKWAPTPVVTSYDREVEEILSDRTVRREYLIKWRDLPDSETSWEVEDLMWQFVDEIKRYHKDGATRMS